MNLREAIARLVEGHHLEETEAEAAMGTIMAGEATPRRLAPFWWRCA